MVDVRQDRPNHTEEGGSANCVNDCNSGGATVAALTTEVEA